MGPRNRVKWGPDPLWERVILREGRRGPFVKYSDTLVICAKMAEPIDLPFGLWTRVGQWKHKFKSNSSGYTNVPDGRAHWRKWQIQLNCPSVEAMWPYYGRPM